jgi:hypothetical protein
MSGIALSHMMDVRQSTIQYAIHIVTILDSMSVHCVFGGRGALRERELRSQSIRKKETKTN